MPSTLSAFKMCTEQMVKLKLNKKGKKCKQYMLKALTVSAAVRLIPSPPALVLSKKTKMSLRVWKSATMSRRSDILEDPSSRM